MGLKWIATLKVEFEMLDGRPDSLALAQTVLAREAGHLKHNIELGRELAATGVKPSPQKSKYCLRGQHTINFAVYPAPVRPCACAKLAIGASGFSPERLSAAASSVLRCRQRMQRTEMDVLTACAILTNRNDYATT